MQKHKDKKYTLPSNLELIIYGKNSKYKHPKNAAIYDEKQELKCWLEAPVFKTEKMIHGIKNEQFSKPGIDVWIIHPHKKVEKNFWGKVLGEKGTQGYFESFLGMKNINGKALAEFMISDGGMYFEYQYLDLNRFQFIEIANWGGKF